MILPDKSTVSIVTKNEIPTDISAIQKLRNNEFGDQASIVSSSFSVTSNRTIESTCPLFTLIEEDHSIESMSSLVWVIYYKFSFSHSLLHKTFLHAAAPQDLTTKSLHHNGKAFCKSSLSSVALYSQLIAQVFSVICAQFSYFLIPSYIVM